ncbi:Retrovirus-related Pol polyprotein from transposon TNT 1-94 [Vitis vinifera]|uniref:Retrovirus-related Pol polyprotein from transposon TNT 1-94 n=1 Tax=Vitis vinifera TaxID=29760 RepID=A0A438CQS9_VITVI|nr:Retrovirus-related Pol polyprotein from transposon TNT 1-94 [Vitis vinifera]
MRNRGFEPWTFRSCLGYQHFVINDHNRDQRKKDSKKTLIATVAEKKIEANVAEKASALVAATNHGVIETQYNAKVRVLRSDNGGEYQSSDLQKYLEGHDIIHHTTCSNTPQQNGVVERKNRHLLEVVRASLIAAKTPISYWGEAITSAAYLINRVPSSLINFQTPLQAFTNVVVAPTVPNLPPCVFGCVAFVHLHKHQRTKLTSHALQCVFVGYALNRKGYRCYHPPTRRMYIAMDVVFHEDSIQSELVNQEAGELDMSGQQFGSKDVFIEVPNQLSFVEGVINLELDPFMKWLPHHHNRAIPNNVREALADPRWKTAMNEEMKSLQKNETWELVECPPGKKPVRCRWIYTVKYKADGSIERFKAKLVAKGYTQTYGIDYTETFALVTKINTV